MAERSGSSWSGTCRRRGRSPRPSPAPPPPPPPPLPCPARRRRRGRRDASARRWRSTTRPAGAIPSRRDRGDIATSRRPTKTRRCRRRPSSPAKPWATAWQLRPTRRRLRRDETADELQRGVGHLAPAAVDGQRVTAVGELDDLRDAAVLLL